MLNSLSLPNFLSAGLKRQNKAVADLKFAKKARVKPVSTFRLWAGLILAALNFAALMWYVAGVNGNASKGYEIKRLQSQISLLEEESQQLNLKVSEAGSMVAIQSDFLNSNFVPAGQATYIRLHPMAINVANDKN